MEGHGRRAAPGVAPGLMTSPTVPTPRDRSLRQRRAASGGAPGTAPRFDDVTNGTYTPRDRSLRQRRAASGSVGQRRAASGRPTRSI